MDADSPGDRHVQVGLDPAICWQKKRFVQNDYRRTDRWTPRDRSSWNELTNQAAIWDIIEPEIAPFDPPTSKTLA